jgi:hypothetical protein
VVDESTKRCPKCARDLPLDNFNWANKEKGYVDSKCRDCRSEAHRRWYRANRDYKLMRNMQGYRARRD